MIELKNVGFKYNSAQEQIYGLSLHIKKGEFVVITGPSGCGKTTLTRIINGLIPHFYEGSLTGEVRLNGQNAADLQPWEFGKLAGSVFQDPRSQFFAAVAEDEIAFCCENYAVPSEEIRARVNDVSQGLHIKPLLLRELLTLSSGEKQKVAVASAAAMGPPVYVLDEPSANLDMEATEELAAILKSLQDGGSTIVVAEHRLYYLMPLADRVLYMTDGRIRHEYTAGQMKALTRRQLEDMGLRATRIEKGEHAPADKVKPTGGAPCVGVQGLCLRVGKNRCDLLSALSFDIYPGEVVALTGANGVGKTTLARTLCGLAREFKGKVLFEGREVKASARCKHAWFVMQDTDCQLFSESVLGEMTVGMKATPVLTKKAEEILTELDLWQYRDRHPASLSGGQKQRLTLAVALMQETELLILDEPTSGLDGRNLGKVVRCVKKQAEKGKAVLIITHDHELVQKVCTRMLQLKDGALTKDFSLREDTYGAAVDCLLAENRCPAPAI